MGNCWGSANSSPSPTHNGSSSPGFVSKNSSSTTTTTTTTNSEVKFSRSIGSNVDGQHSITSSNGDELHPNGRILEAPNLRIFTFAELRSATKNFKPDTILGEGGFGRVFKGWVDEKSLNPAKSGFGMVVAVKKLNPESLQGLEEWQSEVNFLGRLSHPNLVRLLGYCWEDKELLLVYEFMAKGSLENHLFRRGVFQPLSWSLRLKILIGAARGLAFLHTSEKQVIYRDFKASNILLDSTYDAKIADFGLAKNGPTGGDSHVTTRVMGTYGYAAPEYVATGHLYVKSDVYGFGVVLLEMLTGQRALDTTRPSGQHNLVEWAKPFLSNRRSLVRVMDPRLEGQYPSKAAFQASQLTLRCLASEPKFRPSMQEVSDALHAIDTLKGATPGKTSSSSSSAKKPRPPADHRRRSNGTATPPQPHHRSPVHPRHHDVPHAHYQLSPKVR